MQQSRFERFVNWCSLHWFISLLGCFLLFGIIFFLIPFFLTQKTWLFSYNENTSYIGASIAGTAGVGIAFIAAILTFFAFIVQYQANQQQRVAIENDRAAIEHDRLEGRFFELIKLYRASVDEMNIQNVRTGRHCFIPMFKEFRCAYWITKYEYDKYQAVSIASPKISDDDLCKIAYSIFFNGIGIESSKLKTETHKRYPDFIKQVENAIYEIQISYREHAAKSQKKFDTFFIYFNGKSYGQKIGKAADILKLHKKATENNRRDIFIFEPRYFPFDGHVTRLGHYYRNLFEIVRFIVSKEDKILSKDEVLQYLKLLRKQMSNHEQLLLYYNAIVGVGNKWENDNGKNYFIDYLMIHNVPFPLADFGIPIEEKYAEIIRTRKGVFEWQWDT